MDEHKVPLDKIEKVTIPAVVACEVPGCSWLIPNERGSFQEYNHHLCQHTDEELQPLADAAEAFFTERRPNTGSISGNRQRRRRGVRGIRAGHRS